MRSKTFVVGLFSMALLIAACSGSVPRSEILKQQLAPFHSDPDQLQFLIDEAINAGVKEFRFDESTSNYGRSNSKGVITLSTAMPGGTGVINITHEIAHVAGFRKNCNGHERCWLDIYLEIARRYENRFPGVTWSSTSPTRRVLRNANRYLIPYP